MILIFSKDPDSFVNRVIDYLEVDYVRIGGLDNITINNIEIDGEVRFVISGRYLDTIDLCKISGVWFNGGLISTFGNKYENECYSELVDSFLINK